MASVALNSRKSYLWRCPRGHEWKASPSNRINRKSGCPYCSGRLVGEDNSLASRFPDLSAQWANSNSESPSRVLPFDKVPRDWICEQGHLWTALASNRVSQNTGCPSCIQTVSRPQQEIADLLTSWLPGEKVSVSDRQLLGKMELDIWVPSRTFAIEFQGLYWHSKKAPSFRPGAAAHKYWQCVRHRTSLFTVFEDEWKNKRPILESMWRHRLRLPSRVVYARRCRLETVSDHGLARQFFEDNHLEGGVRIQSAVALVSDDEVVGIAALRRHFTGELELARLAFKTGLHVVGGAGRLINALPKPLISFSNNRIGAGNVYKALGFEEVTASRSPGYFYTDFRQRFSRFRCRRINDQEILAAYPSEEAQNAAGLQAEGFLGERRPLFRIEDCGHRKWRLGYTKPGETDNE